MVETTQTVDYLVAYGAQNVIRATNCAT